MQYKNRPTLTSKVYTLLKENQSPESFSALEDLSQQLLERFPEYKNNRIGYLKDEISAICADLEKQGYVERKKFTHNFCSEITMTDEQRQIMVSFVDILDKFRTGDPKARRQGNEFAQRMLANSALFSTLMLKAKEASPYASRRPSEESHSKILSLVEEFPNINTVELETKFEHRVGRKISRAFITKHTKNLVLQGLLTAEQTKSGNTYRINLQLSKP